MAVSLIVASASGKAAQVGLSPLAELVAHLHARTEREHHPQAVPDEPVLPPDLLGLVYSWSPMWAVYRGRFLLPCRPLLGQSLADELTVVADLPIARFAELAGFAVRCGNSGPVLNRLLDDPEQQHQLRHAARLRSTARSELAERLLDAPSEFRSDLLDFLARYAAECFDAEWRQLQPRLQAEVHRLRFRIRDRGLGAALAELSPSAVLIDQPERVVFDTMHAGVVRPERQPYLVVPSHFGWPHLLVKHELGWPVVIQYGVDADDRPRQVPLALVRARLRALSDPARILLCRQILGDELTTVELARRSGMTQQQVSRHLRTLRDLGLVHAARNGRLVHNRLDLAAVRALGPDLERAMLR